VWAFLVPSRSWEARAMAMVVDQEVSCADQARRQLNGGNKYEPLSLQSVASLHSATSALDVHGFHHKNALRRV
ncbi:MAG: hypothetical protein ACKO50_00925, partial [Cyanobium sp.]